MSVLNLHKNSKLSLSNIAGTIFSSPEAIATAPPIQIILKNLLSLTINSDNCSCFGVGNVQIIKSLLVNLGS